MSTPPKLTREQYLAFVGGKPLDQIVSPPPAVAVKAVQQPGPILSSEPFQFFNFLISSLIFFLASFFRQSPAFLRRRLPRRALLLSWRYPHRDQEGSEWMVGGRVQGQERCHSKQLRRRLHRDTISSRASRASNPSYFAFSAQER